MKQAQLWGNTKEATTFTVAFSMDRGPLDMLIEQATKTDAVLPEERTHHVTSENGWAITATTFLQFIATLDNVLNLSKELQAWILLWDTASIHASEGTMTVMKEKFTSYCASSRTKHGQSERQVVLLKAKDMLRKAESSENGNHPTIRSRWKAERRYRTSSAEHGIGEKEIMLYDQIALETHDYTATKAERIQNSKHWVLSINAEGPQLP